MIASILSYQLSIHTYTLLTYTIIPLYYKSIIIYEIAPLFSQSVDRLFEFH